MKKSATVVAFPQTPQPNQMGFLVAVKRFEDGAARVTVEFPSPVSWIALEPDAARAFAVSLQRYADEATSYLTVPPAFLAYYELIERVTRRWPMMQVTREFAEFLAWLVKRGVPKRVLEIGTARGGTAATWCEIGAKRVVSIDLPDGAFGGITPEVAHQRNTALAETYPAFRGLIADSHEVKTVARARASLGGLADLLFIDGDHTAEGVRRDYEMYAPLVKRGGLIVFHDIKDTEAHRKVNCNVATLWETLWRQTKPSRRMEFRVKNADWGGIGVLVKR